MVIDANMYWMPEELFHNAKLLQQFLDAVPQDTAVYQANIPGTMKKNKSLWKSQKASKT